MDLASRSEYLTAITHDNNLITTLASDCKDLLTQLNPTLYQYYNEVDLGIAFLYDIISMFSTTESTLGQELASIEPFSVPHTTSSWINAIEGRLMKYFMSEKGLHHNPSKKMAQFMTSRSASASHPSTVSLPRSSETNVMRGQSEPSRSQTHSQAPLHQPHEQTLLPQYHLHKFNPTLVAYSTTTTATAPNEQHHPLFSSTTPQSLQPAVQLALQNDHIFKQSKPILPLPTKPSIFQKLSVSALTHLPEYIISKTRYSEPLPIPTNANLIKKLHLHLKNILCYHLPQLLQITFPILTYTDCILFFLTGMYLNFAYRYSGIGFLRTHNSPLRGQPMPLESLGFKFAGIVMIVLGLINYGTGIVKITRDIIHHLAKWTKHKIILIYFLMKRLYRSIFNRHSSNNRSSQVSTPSGDDTQQQQQQQQQDHNAQTLSKSSLQNAKLTFPSYSIQLSPHERHKIRKRLFIYTFQLNNVKSGDFFVEGDPFNYQLPTHNINVNAYDLAISSHTDGWSTDAEEENGDNDKSQYEGIWGLDSSSDDETKAKSGDGGLTVEQYVTFARKNRQLYLHLVEPVLNDKSGEICHIDDGNLGVEQLSTQNSASLLGNQTKNENSSATPTNPFQSHMDKIDEDDDRDDGVLYLDARIGGGYSKLSPISFLPDGTREHTRTNNENINQNNKNNEIDDEDDDEDDEAASLTTTTTVMATALSEAQSQHRSLVLSPTQPAHQTLTQPTQPRLKSSCGVCLCRAKATTATMCGHLFCWGCIIHYVQAKRECPTCRTSCLPSQLLRLHQFG